MGTVGLLEECSCGTRALPGVFRLEVEKVLNDAEEVSLDANEVGPLSPLRGYLDANVMGVY